MKRIAVISAILENPKQSQAKFNEVVSEFKGMVRGRMGIPVTELDVTVITITVISELDEINNLTGKLGKIPEVLVKTSISKKEFE